MFDSDFCPDYILPVGRMNKPGFGKSDLDVLEFRKVEINDSESKMFITRFCRQNAQLSHWSDNVSGLMWACTLSFVANPCAIRFQDHFFCPGYWLLATLRFAVIKPQRVLVFFRSNFRGSFFNPILFLSCLRVPFFDLHSWECPVLFLNRFRTSPHKILLLGTLGSIFPFTLLFWHSVFCRICCSFLKQFLVVFPWEINFWNSIFVNNFKLFGFSHFFTLSFWFKTISISF